VPLPHLTVVERARLQVTVGSFGRDNIVSANPQVALLVFCGGQ